MANYVNITLLEFDAFMDAQGFDRINQEERREMYRSKSMAFVESGEHFYEYMMDNAYAPGCRIRIYSSISYKDGLSRHNGSDAIRVVLVDPDDKVYHSGFKRTHRVKGWRLNLLKKYEDVIENPTLHTWQPMSSCSCGGNLSTRYGKYGYFRSCDNWRQCNA